VQQLDVKLRAGRVELSNFALNCDALMAAAAAGGSGGKSSSSNASSSNGFKVTSATVRHLRVHIAYADLLSESLTLHIEGVVIDVAPDDGSSSSNDSSNSANSSSKQSKQTAAGGESYSYPLHATVIL
jgi:N-terminal region of Chorein or VPS13